MRSRPAPQDSPGHPVAGGLTVVRWGLESERPMRARPLTILALSAALLPWGAWAEAAFLLAPLSLPTGQVTTLLYPGIELGSHVDRAGPSLRSFTRRDLGDLDLGFGALLSDKVAMRYLGIPGSGDTFSLGLDALLGLGSEAEALAPAPWPDFPLRRSFEIRYEWICYRDSWGTSQLGGRLEFAWKLGEATAGIAFHNDLFGLLVRDEYRTAAVELATGFRALGAACAFSLGLRLWTGSTWGQGHLSWGQSYDMSLHPPGAGYSAGILYAGFRRGMLGLELGWDSEGIRNFFQNGVHRIIDDGKVPLVERSARPYFALKIFPDGDLY